MGKHEGPWCLPSHGGNTEKDRESLFLGKDSFDPFLVGGKERQFVSYGDLIRFPLQSCSEALCFLPPLVYCSLISFKPQHVLRITELHRCLVRLKIQRARTGHITPVTDCKISL